MFLVGILPVIISIILVVWFVITLQEIRRSTAASDEKLHQILSLLRETLPRDKSL